MGDGPQVRQQLDNVQRVSTTRAWRCLLLLVFISFYIQTQTLPAAARIRLVLYSDTEKCRQLPSGTTRTAVKY